MSSHDKNDGRTHAEGCYAWGRNHYDCALGRIAELEKALREVREHVRDLECYECVVCINRALRTTS